MPLLIFLLHLLCFLRVPIQLSGFFDDELLR